MGWLGKMMDRWLDETDWPQDPALDAFRDAVWELTLNGEHRGWLTTKVTPMRSLPFFKDKSERMWSQQHWPDGTHAILEEDYGPRWFDANNLRAGRFEADAPGESEYLYLDAAPVTGAEKYRLWAELKRGIEPTDGR